MRSGHVQTYAISDMRPQSNSCGATGHSHSSGDLVFFAWDSATRSHLDGFLDETGRAYMVATPSPTRAICGSLTIRGACRQIQDCSPGCIARRASLAWHLPGQTQACCRRGRTNERFLDRVAVESQAGASHCSRSCHLQILKGRRARFTGQRSRHRKSQGLGVLGSFGCESDGGCLAPT